VARKRKRRVGTKVSAEPGKWLTDGFLPSGEEGELAEEFEGSYKLEAAEVRDDWVSYEGLGYCIYELISPQKIADQRLAKLWDKARKAMQEVVEYLELAPESSQVGRRWTKKAKKKRKSNPKPINRKQTSSTKILGEKIGE